MSNFSNSSETQPERSAQAKVWQIAGMVLIGGGLLVMIWAGWMYFQQQAELTNPPAPIVDASAMEALDPPPAQPDPTEPPAIAQSNAADSQPVKVEPSPTPQPQPTDTPIPLPVPTETPVIDETQSGAPGEATPLSQESGAVEVPSLADNPLLVAEDDAEAASDESSADTGGVPSPPTRFVAESINLDTPVIETGWVQVERDGVTANVWVVADYAVGWHDNSALPGEGGNIVLSGHHNIKGEVFRDIVELEVGDTVSVFVGDRQYDYAINDKFIVKDKGEPDSVRQANAKWIGPFNEERLTLVTCWPYNNNTHRVIVIARPL